MKSKLDLYNGRFGNSYVITHSRVCLDIHKVSADSVCGFYFSSCFLLLYDRCSFPCSVKKSLKLIKLRL